MTNNPQVERRYLLGMASQQERDALEDAYFASPDALEGLEDAEDALVESYLDATLSADERAAFERYYLASPIRTRRVEVVRSLRRGATLADSPSRWSGLAVAASALLAVTVAGLVWISGGPARSRGEAPAVAATPTPPSIPTPTVPRRVPIVVALAVPSVTVRGAGGPPTARIPTDADVLALTLQVDPGQPAAAEPLVVVETVEGREIWQGPGTAARGVLVSIPSDRLEGGDYLAVVFDTSGGRRTELAQYFFRVQRTARP